MRAETISQTNTTEKSQRKKVLKIVDTTEACGMVGNKDVNVLAYLGALSRMTERPFGTLIVSRSGAGKSFLQDMVAS
ncbi:MAG: hypothetical protein ACOC4C_05535, partial [Fibrobacterota bacterium]